MNVLATSYSFISSAITQPGEWVVAGVRRDHTHDVRALAVLPDGRLVSGGTKRILVCWTHLSRLKIGLVVFTPGSFALALPPPGVDTSIIIYSTKDFGASGTSHRRIPAFPSVSIRARPHFCPRCCALNTLSLFSRHDPSPFTQVRHLLGSVAHAAHLCAAVQRNSAVAAGETHSGGRRSWRQARSRASGLRARRPQRARLGAV